MGRVRVELKRIENKISRHVCFNKRCKGLLKKAQELSILCDADVSLVVFSANGKFYEFSSRSSGVLKTIERFRNNSYVGSEAVMPSNETQHIHEEYLKLKSKLEALQQFQRNLVGEDLGQLSVEELDQVQNQLEISIEKIRSTKNQVMLDQLCHLKTKEQMLQEANRVLKKKLQDASTKCSIKPTSENNDSGKSNVQADHRPTYTGNYLPVGDTPSKAGSYTPTCTEMMNVGPATQGARSHIPPWMI